MKKSTFDTLVIILALLAPVAPEVFAKELVVIIFIIFFVRILLSGNISLYIKEKLVIFVFFVPGIIFTLFNSPADLIRFAPILLLLAGLPYRGFNLKPTAIAYTSIVMIGYLVITQFFIALDSPALVLYRDSWYPIENNVWAYGSVDSLIYGFSEFRAAGVFYNPNVLGLVLVLYFFVYSHLRHKSLSREDAIIFSNKTYFLMVTITVFSVFFNWFPDGAHGADWVPVFKIYSFG